MHLCRVLIFIIILASSTQRFTLSSFSYHYHPCHCRLMLHQTAHQEYSHSFTPLAFVVGTHSPTLTSRCRDPFMSILLLSGNIELNPGPYKLHSLHHKYPFCTTSSTLCCLVWPHRPSPPRSFLSDWNLNQIYYDRYWTGSLYSSKLHISQLSTQRGQKRLMYCHRWWHWFLHQRTLHPAYFCPPELFFFRIILCYP